MPTQLFVENLLLLDELFDHCLSLAELSVHHLLELAVLLL